MICAILFFVVLAIGIVLGINFLTKPTHKCDFDNENPIYIKGSKFYPCKHKGCRVLDPDMTWFHEGNKKIDEAFKRLEEAQSRR